MSPKTVLRARDLRTLQEQTRAGQSTLASQARFQGQPDIHGACSWLPVLVSSSPAAPGPPPSHLKACLFSTLSRRNSLKTVENGREREGNDRIVQGRKRGWKRKGEEESTGGKRKIEESFHIKDPDFVCVRVHTHVCMWVSVCMCVCVYVCVCAFVCACDGSSCYIGVHVCTFVWRPEDNSWTVHLRHYQSVHLYQVT